MSTAITPTVGHLRYLFAQIAMLRGIGFVCVLLVNVEPCDPQAGYGFVEVEG